MLLQLALAKLPSKHQRKANFQTVCLCHLFFYTENTLTTEKFQKQWLISQASP